MIQHIPTGFEWTNFQSGSPSTVQESHAPSLPLKVALPRLWRWPSPSLFSPFHCGLVHSRTTYPSVSPVSKNSKNGAMLDAFCVACSFFHFVWEVRPNCPQPVPTFLVSSGSFSFPTHVCKLDFPSLLRCFHGELFESVLPSALLLPVFQLHPCRGAARVCA